MKYSITIISIAAIFLVIIGAAFEFNLPIKDTLLTQYYAIQSKGQVVEKQYASTKRDSFHVATTNAVNQSDSNSIDPMVHKGKIYLTKQVDKRIGQLKPYRDRMQNMAVALNDAGMKSLVSGLNADLDAFKVLKEEINKCTTQGDVNVVADRVKATWIKNRLNVDHAKELALVSKETQLVSDADVASISMKKRIDSLKAAGKGQDAKPYEKLLAAYTAKVASAKRNMEAVDKNFKAIANAATDEDKQQLAKGNSLLLASSRENIKGAYKLVSDEARKDFARRMP
jgi:hypothetical protein